ncbi:MAG: hypothetical protein JWN54_3040, partial [Mycobacterium sp.]|nr:hypothetical protein [Mycobacterium sp.]
MYRRRTRVLLAVTVAAAVATGCSTASPAAPSPAASVAERFLAAWAAGRPGDAAALTDATEAAQAGLAA